MSAIPFFPYKLFFIYIEPISALAGAFYAAFRSDDYITDLTRQSWPKSFISNSTPVNMVLVQLANLYLLFALNEHLVLSSTSSIKTWKRLLFGLLVADLGHLISMAPLGFDVFWKVGEWNAMLWGSIGFVYFGATLRVCFLAGIGLDGELSRTGKRIRRSVPG